MTEPQTIKINEVEYIRSDSQSQVEYNGDLKIVILQRGWVMVGRLERAGSHCLLHNASVIRVWGTKQGLGEIASGGPTANTVLDPCGGLVEFHELTIVATIACNPAKWTL